MNPCCMLPCCPRTALPGDPTPWGKPCGVVGRAPIMGGVPGEPCWKGDGEEPGDLTVRFPCGPVEEGMGGGGLGGPTTPPGPGWSPLGWGAAN